MMVIRRINPASAFKVGFMLNAFLGLLLGALCTITALVGATFMSHAHTNLFGSAGQYIGQFAIILCPIVYGIVGGVVAVIGAAVYNLASSWIGGLEVELT